jgi:hypothetical protein
VDGKVVREVVVVAAEGGSQVTAIVPRGPNAIGPDQEPGLEQTILKAMAPLEAHKRVSRVIFTDLDVANDPQFRTRNLKLDRIAVAKFFLSRPAKDAPSAIAI